MSPFRGWLLWPIRVSICLALLSQQACDSESARKEAEAALIAAVDVPAGYTAIGQWEEGNGGGGPVRALERDGARPGAADDLALPPGYQLVESGEASGESLELWIPALERTISWSVAETFTGPTIQGDGTCRLVIGVGTGTSDRLLILVPTCNLEED